MANYLQISPVMGYTIDDTFDSTFNPLLYEVDITSLSSSAGSVTYNRRSSSNLVFTFSGNNYTVPDTALRTLVSNGARYVWRVNDTVDSSNNTAPKYFELRRGARDIWP